MDYKIIKSKRKTISITVNKQCEVIVKAPLKMSTQDIQKFIEKNILWIEKQKQKHTQNASLAKPLNESEIDKLKIKANEILSQKTKIFADIIGVNCNKIKITNAKTRWGSCSWDNNICYSYRVMLLDDDCVDYIVVHELCHVLHKNHSKEFYKEIEKVIPNYKYLISKIKNFSNFDLY